jgi:hypothetical protein
MVYYQGRTYQLLTLRTQIEQLSEASTVVEPLTLNPKFEGLNPAPGTGREQNYLRLSPRMVHASL